jgi:uncharacterized protein (TIGR02284 family)
MHAADEKPLKALNTLIGVNSNRIECFHYANKVAGNSILKVLFERLAETSETCLVELVREVYKLGGVPHEGTMATPDFVKAWNEIQSAVSRKDHLSILNAFCRQEGIVLKSYEDLLAQEQEIFNSIQYRVCASQYEAIKSDAEKVKNLRQVVINSAVANAVKVKAKVARVKEDYPMIPVLSYH